MDRSDWKFAKAIHVRRRRSSACSRCSRAFRSSRGSRPISEIADGLSAAFKSDKTPAFGQMLSTLFNNSTGDQKAGVINQLLASVPPGTLTTLLSGAGLAGVLGQGTTQVTPEQAQQISPEAVQQLATQAHSANPSVIDSVSNFYAQHTTLVKTLGGAALTVCLAKVAEKQKQA